MAERKLVHLCERTSPQRRRYIRREKPLELKWLNDCPGKEWWTHFNLAHFFEEIIMIITIVITIIISQYKLNFIPLRNWLNPSSHFKLGSAALRETNAPSPPTCLMRSFAALLNSSFVQGEISCITSLNSFECFGQCDLKYFQTVFFSSLPSSFFSNLLFHTVFDVFSGKKIPLCAHHGEASEERRRSEPEVGLRALWKI